MNVQIIQQAKVLIAENSAALLTGTGVVGVVTTAVLSARASFKASELLQGEYHSRSQQGEDKRCPPLPTKEKVKFVWPLYIPAVTSGITTITAILFSYRIQASQSAALAAAYGISEKGFQEYKDKVVEKLGVKKETEEIRDDLAKDRIEKTPIEGQTIVLTSGGDVLCFDSYSGRYFQSSVEAIKKAENAINYEILHHLGASVSSFYDLIGLLPTQYSEEMGWNTSNPLDISISAQKVEDKPCLVIDFKVLPVINYESNY